jgi:UDP-N-acetylglucosamine 3-dehydrogenase
MSERVRIGMIGCGLFGESHLQAYRAVPAAEIRAVYDIDRSRAEETARVFSVPRVCQSLEELVALPELDAVDVITPEETHLPPVLAAIGAGKHVFVEKPLATDLDHCDQMIRAAENARKILMVGQIVRFETKAAMLKDEVASGRLGNIVSMHARRNRLKKLLPRYGRTHPVIENSIHDIDLMLWYTGDRVERVRGYDRSATHGKHADTFWGVLEFAGGPIGVVETIWLLPDQAGILLDDAFQLIGDQGVGNMSFFPGGLSFWRDGGFEVPDISYDPRVGGAARGALRDELAYFCECVQQGCPPRQITPREAKNAVRVAMALMESAAHRRDVEITAWD